MPDAATMSRAYAEAALYASARAEDLLRLTPQERAAAGEPDWRGRMARAAAQSRALERLDAGARAAS